MIFVKTENNIKGKLLFVITEIYTDMAFRVSQLILYLIFYEDQGPLC